MKRRQLLPLIFLLVFWWLGIASAQDLHNLRREQALELLALKVEYAGRAKGLEGEEYDSLLQEYSQKRKAIQNSYKAKDSRSVTITDIQKRFDGDIVNTGSMPRNVDADVDLAAQTDEAAARLVQEWQQQGHQIVDSGYKIENKTTDTVLWRPETSERRQAMAGDHDAYQTTGGRKSTGNVREPSSFSGAGLDPARKMVHADMSGDVKTFGKGFSKLYEQAYGAQTFERDAQTGKVLQKKSLPNGGGPLYDKCKRLQNYGDPIEAGIYKLDDPSEVRQKKWDDFRREVYNEAGKAQKTLDKRFSRQLEALEALEASVTDPATKQRIRERIDARVESNRVAREDIRDMFRSTTDPTTKSFDIEPAPPMKRPAPPTDLPDIAKTDRTPYPDTPAHGPVTRGGKLAKLRSGAMNAADWLVTAYEFNDTVKRTEEAAKSGEHEFVSIDDDDSPTVRNAKVYGWALFESTPVGGGFSVGRQADNAEKQRILEAIRKGETVNPVVSWLRATGESFYNMAYGMTFGVLEGTADKLAEAAFEIKQLRDTLAENELRAQEQENAPDQARVVISSMTVSPSETDATHQQRFPTDEQPRVVIAYQTGPGVTAVTAVVSAQDASGAMLAETTLQGTPQGRKGVLVWNPVEWDRQDGAETRFVARLTPSSAGTTSPVMASARIVAQDPYSKPTVNLRATQQTYAGPLLTEPVVADDIVAVQAEIQPQSAEPTEAKVLWRVLRPDGSPVDNLVKEETLTLQGESVTSGIRFQIKAMDPGRYTVQFALSPVDAALPGVQGATSFAVVETASIQRLLVTHSPDAQRHSPQLDTNARPHFYLYYNLPTDTPEADIILTISRADTGETLTQKAFLRERKGDNPQRVGLRMEPGVYPTSAPLQFAATVTPEGGDPMTGGVDFTIAPSLLTVLVPQQLEAGQSGKLAIRPPKGLRLPYSVDIDASGPVAVGATRNALDGTITAMDHSGTGVVRVTLTDADGRVLSGTGKIAVQGIAQAKPTPSPSSGAKAVAGQADSEIYKLGLQRWRKAAIAHVDSVIIPCARTKQFNSIMADLRTRNVFDSKEVMKDIMKWGRADSSQLPALNKELGYWMYRKVEQLVEWWPNTACFRQAVDRMAEAAEQVGRTSNAEDHKAYLMRKLSGPKR
jgi:hypothetical protein